MLLNYLYANFFEQDDFAPACGVTRAALAEMIAARTIPAPSYVYEVAGRSRSFVNDERDEGVLRFHLRGQIDWVRTVRRFGLDTEARARAHFEARYDAAKAAFLSGDLGQRLVAAAPDVPGAFGAEKAEATWGYFLDGVYGVCTRDGLPDSVFLKQVGVMFLEAMIEADTPDIGLLREAVDTLDGVESEFAPHEVAHSSRQRCIIDVRERFLNDAQRKT